MGERLEWRRENYRQIKTLARLTIPEKSIVFGKKRGNGGFCEITRVSKGFVVEYYQAHHKKQGNSVNAAQYTTRTTDLKGSKDAERPLLSLGQRDAKMVVSEAIREKKERR